MAQLEAADSVNLTERREREPSDEQETLHTVKKVSEKVGERGGGHEGRGALRAHACPAKPDGALMREHPYVIWVYVEPRPLKTHTHPVSKRCLLGCGDRVKKRGAQISSAS